MATSTPSLKLIKTSLVAGLFASAGALFGAGEFNYYMYLTRGTETTTTQNIFATVDSGTGNGLTLSERFIKTTANAIDQLEPLGTVNTDSSSPTYGCNTGTAQTPDYGTTYNDGQIYLHIGYHNSGFVGSNETVEDLILNGNFTVGRIAIENQNGTTPTANLLNTIVGDSKYTLKFKVGNKTNENFFFRGLQGSTFTLDTNISVENFLNTGQTDSAAHIFVIGGGGGTSEGNTLQIGTVANAKTLTINNTAMATLAATNRNVFALNGKNASLIVNNKINLNDNVVRSLVYFQTNHGNESAVLNGDITVNKNMATSNNITYKMFETKAAGQLVTVNGKIDVKSTANSASTTFFASLAGGSYLNLNNTITSARTAETSFNMGSATNKAVANFRGSESNSFHTIGLRNGVANFMKTGGAKALTSSNVYMGTGGDVIINSFNGQQMDLSSSTIALWGAANVSGRLISGTINMNGTQSLTLKSFSDNGNGNSDSKPLGDGRSFVLDFGMTRSGMTEAQKTASGITAGMINETGAGVAQTFTLTGTLIQVASKHTSAAAEDDGVMNHIYINNYIVGEDKIICGVKLSATNSKSGNALFSETVLDNNLFIFEVSDDSLVYGVDYWFTETQVDGGWEYSVAYIPEASEIAALFGVAALVFALYRRRK